MPHFIDILSPHYQKLLTSCDRRKIAVNLDIQDLTVNIRNAEQVDQFFASEIKRAIKNCGPNDKITLAQTVDSQSIRISVKNSGRSTLAPEEKNALHAAGYEVRARFGYDTVITLVIER